MALQFSSSANALKRCYPAITLILLASSIVSHSLAFTKFCPNNGIAFTSQRNLIMPSSSSLFVSTTPPTSESTPLPFETEIPKDSTKTYEDEFASSSIEDIKSRLLDLLPRMTGTKEENELVSALVNSLEAKYKPVLTLEFFNMAQTGDWQLLFSTNMLGKPSATLRLRELVQKVEPKAINSMKGEITNVALWDYAAEDFRFDASGTMNIKNSYDIGSNGAARMKMKLENHAIKLGKGSRLPSGDEVQKIVGMIHNTMPKELFDPNGLGMDTTFLDANLRIVRLTANIAEENGVLIMEDGETEEEFMERRKLLKYEGVRNIFIRKNSIEIRPTE